jgi:hypothetical protein
MKKNIVFDNAIQSIEQDSKIDNFISLSDSPITDEKQDRLKRTCFIKNLYGQITSLPFDDSFCFGLYGNWGEGKTSAINLVKNRLHNDENNIIFEFDPWYLTSKEAILKYFIDELERKLKPTSKEFKVLKKYFSRINTVGVTILGSGFNTGWIAGQNDIIKLKKNINNLLIRFKKKIFIFIDDIDRLQCDEILLVFKIIKLIGNFKHTIFVLSMDVECVEKTLRNNQIDTDFIDKIVQKQIHLPKAEQNDIEQFFMSEIDNLFQNLNIGNDRKENELEQLFIVYKKHLIKQFSTIRDVKRYLNSLSASLPPVVGEVHLLDFLILEIIKVFFPSLYNNIFENWWFYVGARSESDRWINPLLSLVSNDENKCADIIESHVNTILEDHPKRELFLNLLGIIFLEINATFKLYKDFDTVAKDRQSRRIYTTSFLKYFLQRVPNNELSDSLIKCIVNSWVEISPDKLENEILDVLVYTKDQEMLCEFLMKLDILDSFIPNKIAPSLIRSIYKYSKSYSRSGGFTNIGSELHTAKQLLVNLLKHKIDSRNEAEELLSEIILKCDSYNFICEVYLQCISGWNMKSNISKDFIDRINNDFVKTQNDYFQTGEPDHVLITLWRLYATIEKVKPKDCSFSNYVKNLINKDPLYIGKILNCFLSKPVGKKTIRYKSILFDINEVSNFFDINTLCEEITKQRNNVFATDEEKVAVDFFLEQSEMLKSQENNDT